MSTLYSWTNPIAFSLSTFSITNFLSLSLSLSRSLETSATF